MGITRSVTNPENGAWLLILETDDGQIVTVLEAFDNPDAAQAEKAKLSTHPATAEALLFLKARYGIMAVPLRRKPKANHT